MGRLTNDAGTVQFAESPDLHADQEEAVAQDGSIPAKVSGLVARHRYGLVGAWLSVTLLAMIGYARQKPFWGDEVIYRWIVTEPSIKWIFRDLLLSLNNDPPVTHLITHGVTLIFGSGQIGLRLPEMLGVCMALLCLFLTLEIYVDSLFALAGMLFPFTSLLIFYGWEARPYGLMYGFLSLAVLAWCKLGAGTQHKRAWAAALAAALALMLGCHFYAVFALPAFYTAEMVRGRRLRKIAWATWLAIASASASELLYLPLILADRKYADGYFQKPELHSIPDMLTGAFPSAAALLFVFLVLAVPFAVSRRAATDPAATGERRAGDDEFAALALTLSLIPIIGWLAGIFVLKAFVTRYVLHGLMGLFLLLPLVASRFSRGNPKVALLLILTFAGWGLHVVGRGWLNLVEARDPMRSAHPSDPRPFDLASIQSVLGRGQEDVVVANMEIYLPLADYAPALKGRLIDAYDIKMAYEVTRSTTVDHWMEDASRIGWVRGVPWAEYRQRSFLLLTTAQREDDGSWLARELAETHRLGPVIATAGKYVIVQVNAPAAGAGNEP